MTATATPTALPAETGPGRAGRALGVARRLPWEAALAALCLLFFAWRPIPELPVPGLDPSWMGGLHMAAHSELRWGVDLVFTYGPLGWLRQNMYWYEDSGRLALAYLVVCRLALFGVLWALTRRIVGRLLAAVVLLPVAWVIEDPIQVLGAVGALWFAGRGRELPFRTQAAVMVALGSLSAWELLGKVNVGILIGAVTTVALVFFLPRARALQLFGILAGSFVTVLVLAWLFTGQAVGDLPEYLRNAAHIVSGYSDAMGIETAGLEWQYWAMGIVWAGGVACIFLFSETDDWSRRLGLLGVWSAISFFVFKAGFVRHDLGHSTIPFATLAAVALALPWKRTVPARIAAIVLALGPIGVYMYGYGLTIPQVVAPAEHREVAAQHLSGLYDWERRRVLREGGIKAVQAAEGLTSETLGALTGKTVDVWPWETAVVWAYDLTWSPQPVFQGYQANTEDLDELNREHLESPRAPERMLVGPNTSVDGRVASFDNPLVARELVCRYAPLNRQDDRWLVLRRAQDRCGEPVKLTSHQVDWGQPVAVPAPHPDGLVYADIEGAEVAGAERVRSMLLRGLDRSIGLGPKRVQRVIPGTIGGGLPVASGKRIDFPGPFALAPDAPSLTIDRADRPRGGRPLRVTFYEVRVAGANPSR